MLLRNSLLLAAAVISSSAFARIEVEIGAGQATKKVTADESLDDVEVKSTDLNLYFGYRFDRFPLSIGLLVSQKNYDVAELSKQISANARYFYEDPSIFPSPAEITSAEAKGSWKGLVYGPQFSLSFGWRYFDPYLRGSYQVGTLKSVIDYTSSGNYMGDPVAYDYSFENDLKASLIQYAIGFRIPMGMTYFFADYGVEKLKTTTDEQTFKSRTLQGGVESENSQTFTDSATDNSDGKIFRAGLGLSF